MYNTLPESIIRDQTSLETVFVRMIFFVVSRLVVGHNSNLNYSGPHEKLTN